MQTPLNRGSNLAREVSAGVTLFLAMVYVVVAVPGIFGNTGALGLASQTAIFCAVGTLVFGATTKLPYGVGPGLVPASMFAVFLHSGIPLPTVLGIGTMAGALLFLLAVSGCLTTLVTRLSNQIKNAVSFSIGLFLLMVALDMSKLSKLEGSSRVFELSIAGIIFLSGLALAAWMQERPALRKFAVLSGILLATVAAASCGIVARPAVEFAIPHLRFRFAADLTSAMQLRYIDKILTLFYVLLVDIIATLQVTAQVSDGALMVNGKPKNLQRSLVMSGLLATITPILGGCPMIVFFESISAVLSGGTTFIVSLTAGICFLAVATVSSLSTVVPPFASAVALAVVGYSIAKHAYTDLEKDSLSILLLIVGVIGTLCFKSIALALLLSYSLWLLAKAFGKERRMLNTFEWISGSICLVLLVLNGIQH